MLESINVVLNCGLYHSTCEHTHGASMDQKPHGRHFIIYWMWPLAKSNKIVCVHYNMHDKHAGFLIDVGIVYG